MKRLFVETNGYNFVAFADDEKAYYIDESRFNEHLTLDVAKSTDYSNFDGCETAEDCNHAMGENGENVYDSNELLAYADTITEF